MIRQHSFALIRADKAASLTAIANQPTGEFVTVMGNDGTEQQVEELHGGYAYIGRLANWIAVLASGTDAGFATMQALAGDGVVEMVRLSEGWPELDEAADATTVNVWLTTQGLATISPATVREMVEQVCGLFLDGFTTSSVYVD